MIFLRLLGPEGVIRSLASERFTRQRLHILVGLRPLLSSPASFSPSSRLIETHALGRAAHFATSLTRVRISTPPVVISMISSSLAYQCSPPPACHCVRWSGWRSCPGVPRPWRVYSRYRRALAETVFGRGQHREFFALCRRSSEITCCPFAELHAAHAARAAAHRAHVVSSKRTALPAVGKQHTSCLPSVSATPIR